MKTHQKIHPKQGQIGESKIKKQDTKVTGLKKYVLLSSRCFLTKTKLLEKTKIFMKKLFFIVALGVAGIMSANDTQSLPTIEKNQRDEKKVEKIEIVKTNSLDRLKETTKCYKMVDGVAVEVECPDIIIIVKE